MMTLDQVYEIDAPWAKFSEISPSGWWFHEVREWGDRDDDCLARIDAHARLQLKVLGISHGNGNRYALLATIWYNGCPVMIVQEGERSGAEHAKRWITDVNEYQAMCAYIRSQLQVDFTPVDDDVADGSTMFYTEELFSFCGNNFADLCKVVAEPKMPGFTIFRNGHGNTPRLWPNVDHDYFLVCMTDEVDQAPAYVRRDNFVMRLVRAITEEEYACNSSLDSMSKNHGYTKHCWYEHEPRHGHAGVVRI